MAGPAVVPAPPPEPEERPSTHGPELLTGAPVSQECIRLRAYELYERRGHGDGGEVDDWLAAEAELCGH